MSGGVRRPEPQQTSFVKYITMLTYERICATLEGVGVGKVEPGAGSAGSAPEKHSSGARHHIPILPAHRKVKPDGLFKGPGLTVRRKYVNITVKG